MLAFYIGRHHGVESAAWLHGFSISRRKRAFGDGGNRWSGAHRLDVARLDRLALEKGLAGKSYNAIADEGVTSVDIAEIVGRHLNLPMTSISPEKAADHFGMMAMFAGMDGPASSALAQQWLGWKPTQIGLIADISRPGYFSV